MDLNPPKIAKKRLTINDKVEIIKQKSKGRKIPSLCKEYNISRNAIYKILKKEEVIKSFSKTVQADKITKIPNVKFQELENRLFQWFQKQNAEKIPVTCKSLRCEASLIANELGLIEFKASNGWLHKVKKRLSIKQLAPPLNEEDGFSSEIDCVVKTEIIEEEDDG